MDLTKNIEDYDLVFLDVETTGLDVVTGDSICEIGAFKTRNRKLIDKFHSLINPQKSMPEEAYRIHRISDEQLKNAPYFEEIADRLISFLETNIICAYNVGFDMGFVDHHLKITGYPPLNIPALDILLMARDVLNLPKYDLETTAKFFDINCGKLHRALDDAYVAYQIFFKLLDIFKKKKLVKLAEFLSLYGLNNEILISTENSKVSLFKEAIDRNRNLKIRYFSYAKNIEEEKVFPLRVSQENQGFYLLYRNSKGESYRLRLNRILNIEEV